MISARPGSRVARSRGVHRLWIFLVLLVPWTGLSQNLDIIGWTDLNAREPLLNGAGVTLAQAEAGTAWQPGPDAAGQSSSLFTYFSSDATYPVDTGDPEYPTKWEFNPSLQSGHANAVASAYFNANNGVARSPAGIEAFSALYFFNSVIFPGTPVIDSEIINQSFIFNPLSENDAALVRLVYDNYAAAYGKLFVNGVNNGSGTAPPEPSTMYNGISVGLSNGGGSTGPTSDGRSKPDLVAPGGATSYSTPYVAGAAALLLQAARRGDGGAGTETVAADIRTLKTLLINGAVKPVGWSRQSGEPLDRNLGAGVLNVNRSHLQLGGGRHGPTVIGEVNAGDATPPTATSNRVSSSIGWNLATIQTRTDQVQGQTVTYDGVHDYHFDLSSGGSRDATATLVWNRQVNQSAINNLQLKLYSYPANSLVTESVSTVDNVEHIHFEGLAPGEYVLQVVSLFSDRVSQSENYSLAFAFEEIPPPVGPSNLNVAPASDTSLALTWTDIDGNEDGYLVYRLNGGMGQFEQITSLGPDVTTFTDTGLLPSTAYTYRVEAFNASGQSSNSGVTGITYSELEYWRVVHFGTPNATGDFANDGDYDLDTLDNLLEYGLGTSPASSTGVDGPAALPVMSIEEDAGTEYLTLTVTRDQIEPGIAYAVKVSGDLVMWSDDVTVLTNTATEFKVRDNTPFSAGGPRFIRLEVTEL